MMNKKYHKNWEEVRRFRGYTRDKYPSFPFLKSTKMSWIVELSLLLLFLPGYVLLLWLYFTEHSSLLIMPLSILGVYGVIRVLRLWKLKSVFRNSNLKTTDHKKNTK
jgi:hypothetical protein